jgi:hypothetical protein
MEEGNFIFKRINSYLQMFASISFAILLPRQNLNFKFNYKNSLFLLLKLLLKLTRLNLLQTLMLF